MLMRGMTAPEVLLLRRSANSTFAPDAYVFPGGAEEPADRGDLRRTAARELFEEARVRVDADALLRFSHWITPPGQPRRFDTTFFVAAAPDADAIVTADGRETHDARWIAPSDALRLCAIGTLQAIFPTKKHLERLASFASVDALLSFTATKRIVTIAPDASPDEGYVIPQELEGNW